MSWLPLPSTDSRRMSVRPLRRYYGKLRFLLRLLTTVLLIVPPRYLGWHCLSLRGPAPQPRTRTHLINRRPTAVIFPRNKADLPSSQGFLASMPGSSTPTGRLPRSISGSPVLPSVVLKTSAPAERVISVLNHRGLLARCLRLTANVTAGQSKTRFRVGTSLARVGLAPTGNQCAVSVNQPPYCLTSPAPELCSAHQDLTPIRTCRYRAAHRL